MKSTFWSPKFDDEDLSDGEEPPKKRSQHEFLSPPPEPIRPKAALPRPVRTLDHLKNAQTLQTISYYHPCTENQRQRLTSDSGRIENARLKVTDLCWVTEALFPVSLIPPFDSEQLFESGIWDVSRDCIRTPSSLIKSNFIGHFLNDLAVRLGAVFGIEGTTGHSRRWYNSTICCSTPYLSLRSPSAPDSTACSSLSIAEVTALDPSPATRSVTALALIDKAQLMFRVEPHRVFLIGLSFFGPVDNLSWRLTFIDRGKVASTNIYSLHGDEGVAFCQAIFSLIYGSPEVIGLDPTMDLELAGDFAKVKRIKMECISEGTSEPVQRTFTPLHLVHNPLSLIGRGTWVWLVKEASGSDVYILKDSWQIDYLSDSEANFIGRIHETLSSDAPSYARFKHCYPEVTAFEELDHSNHGRCLAFSSPSGERAHHRFLTPTIGDPLTTFESKFQLIKVMIDVVELLEYCANNVGIMHADISVSNILIKRVTENGRTQAYGMLNDWNCARLVDGTKESLSMVTGTFPYLPLDAIESHQRYSKKQYTHRPGYDLESLLNVLIVVCAYTRGPGKLRKNLRHYSGIASVGSWFDRDAFDSDYCYKRVGFLSQDIILRDIAEYWLDFKPYLHRLLEACIGMDRTGWPDSDIKFPNIARHDTFKAILGEALEMYRTEGK